MPAFPVTLPLIGWREGVVAREGQVAVQVQVAAGDVGEVRDALRAAGGLELDVCVGGGQPEVARGRHALSCAGWDIKCWIAGCASGERLAATRERVVADQVGLAGFNSFGAARLGGDGGA